MGSIPLTPSIRGAWQRRTASRENRSTVIFAPLASPPPFAPPCRIPAGKPCRTWRTCKPRAARSARSARQRRRAKPRSENPQKAARTRRRPKCRRGVAVRHSPRSPCFHFRSRARRPINHPFGPTSRRRTLPCRCQNLCEDADCAVGSIVLSPTSRICSSLRGRASARRERE